MPRAEWESIVLALLHNPSIESSDLDPFWDQGWSPKNTADHIYIQLRDNKGCGTE